MPEHQLISMQSKSMQHEQVEYDGAQLDCLVAKIVFDNRYNPTIVNNQCLLDGTEMFFSIGKSGLGEHLISAYGITTIECEVLGWMATIVSDQKTYFALGATKVLAAMRCLVKSRHCEGVS